MLSRLTKWICCISVLSLITGTPFLCAQITPSSGLKNFKLPKYNEEGFREYTLEGIEGIYNESGLITVKSAKLKLYSGDASQILKTTIKTDLATLDRNKDFASGDSTIEVKNSDFQLKGKGWSLDLNKKQIRINSKGTIRFNQAIDFDFDQIFE